MIAEVSTDCRLDVDADEYVDTFKPFSMDIVYQWSQVGTCNLGWSLIAAHALAAALAVARPLSSSRPAVQQVQHLSLRSLGGSCVRCHLHWPCAASYTVPHFSLACMMCCWRLASQWRIQQVCMHRRGPSLETSAPTRTSLRAAW